MGLCHFSCTNPSIHMYMYILNSRCVICMSARLGITIVIVSNSSALATELRLFALIHWYILKSHFISCMCACVGLYIYYVRLCVCVHANYYFNCCFWIVFCISFLIAHTRVPMGPTQPRMCLYVHPTPYLQSKCYVWHQILCLNVTTGLWKAYADGRKFILSFIKHSLHLILIFI